MKIGIISENFSHDSQALKVLLEKQFKPKHIFIPILKKIEGTKVLNPKNIALINIAAKRKKLNLVILAKDLDASPSNQQKIKTIQKNLM